MRFRTRVFAKKKRSRMEAGRDVEIQGQRTLEKGTGKKKTAYVIVRLSSIELYYTRIKRRRGARTITSFQWFSRYFTSFSSFL